jgi:hypothetical protein
MQLKWPKDATPLDTYVERIAYIQVLSPDCINLVVKDLQDFDVISLSSPNSENV